MQRLLILVLSVCGAATGQIECLSDRSIVAHCGGREAKASLSEGSPHVTHVLAVIVLDIGEYDGISCILSLQFKLGQTWFVTATACFFFFFFFWNRNGIMKQTRKDGLHGCSFSPSTTFWKMTLLPPLPLYQSGSKPYLVTTAQYTLVAIS